MQTPTFRSRTVPEVLDAGFQMIRATYGQLALIALVITSPALVLQMLAGKDAVGGLATLLQGFLANYVVAAAVVLVSEAYLGRSIGTGEVLRRVASRFGSIWGAGFIRGFLLGFGLLLLVIPGIIALIVTFAMPMAVMVEGASSSDSFERSRALARENWGRIALTLGLTVVLQYVAVIGAGMMLGLLLGDTTTANVLVQVVATLMTPFPAVVGTVLYYDLRIRKEAFDIQMLVDAMGPGPVQETPAVAF
jgi:hypothetical protein